MLLLAECDDAEEVDEGEVDEGANGEYGKVWSSRGGHCGGCKSVPGIRKCGGGGITGKVW